MTAGAAVLLQRLAALSFDVGDSDLPLRIAFPLLMTNAVHWLAGDAPEKIASVVAGENIPLASGATISTEPVTAFDAKPDPAKIATGFLQPLHNGFHLVTQQNVSSWLAVNTFSEAESDLRNGPATTTAPAALPLTALANFSGWPLWQYLALAALLLFTIEWWLFHRRRTE